MRWSTLLSLWKTRGDLMLKILASVKSQQDWRTGLERFQSKSEDSVAIKSHVSPLHGGIRTYSKLTRISISTAQYRWHTVFPISVDVRSNRQNEGISSCRMVMCHLVVAGGKWHLIFTLEREKHE